MIVSFFSVFMLMYFAALSAAEDNVEKGKFLHTDPLFKLAQEQTNCEEYENHIRDLMQKEEIEKFKNWKPGKRELPHDKD